MTRPEVEVLEASPDADAELSDFFEACPNSVAQQTPGWRDAIRQVGVDEPLFLGCRRERQLVGVLPAYRYSGPLGSILTSCAQAGPLGGIAALPNADAVEIYAALLEGFVALARRRGCAVATVITNPFWPDRQCCERALELDYTLENVCQVLDLAEGVDDAGRLTQATGNLRKALESPLRIDEEQSSANVEAWLRGWSS